MMAGRKSDSAQDSNTQSKATWRQRCIQIFASARASDWLLVCGILLVVGSVPLTWLRFPYSFNVGGWELPVQNLVPHIHEFSYGFCGIGILAVALYFRKRFKWSLLLGTAILLTLWAFVPGRITFHQAPLLRRLSEEGQAVSAVKAFTSSFLHPGHQRIEVRKQFDVVTLPGRAAASLSILGVGWFCFGLGALLLAGYAVSRLQGQMTVASLIVIFVPIGALAILGLRSFMGYHYYDRGSVARAAGKCEQAIGSYRKAMRWDNFYTTGIEVFDLVGEMESQGGLAPGSPERAIHRAEDLHAKRQFERAIAELKRAETQGTPALAKAAHHEALRIQAEWGLARYQAGAVGDAVAKWQEALDEDSKGRPLKSQPSVLYVLPYLARGYYELGRYQVGLKAAQQWIETTSDHPALKADAYRLAGDCYDKLGREAEARRCSSLSRAIAGM